MYLSSSRTFKILAQTQWVSIFPIFNIIPITVSVALINNMKKEEKEGSLRERKTEKYRPFDKKALIPSGSMIQMYVRHS